MDCSSLARRDELVDSDLASDSTRKFPGLSSISVSCTDLSSGVAVGWLSTAMAVVAKVKVKEGMAYPAKPVARIAAFARIGNMVKLVVWGVCTASVEV